MLAAAVMAAAVELVGAAVGAAAVGVGASAVPGDTKSQKLEARQSYHQPQMLQ